MMDQTLFPPLRLNNLFTWVLCLSKIKTRLALNNVSIRVFHDNFPEIIIYSVLPNLDTPLNKDDLDNVAVVDSYDVCIKKRIFITLRVIKVIKIG